MTRSTPRARTRPGVARAAALLGTAAFAGLMLAGCGGDDDTPAASSTSAGQVPVSATVSSASFEAFAIGLPQTDSGEPLALDNITTLPTSETEEPITLAAD